jgi:hypothetical protein
MPAKNITAKAEQARQNRLASGLLADRFPNVAGLVIRMTYYQKGTNPVLMLRTVHISPADFAYFVMDCMIKDCSDGGFDLTPVISDMVKTRKKTGKGKLDCHGKTEPETPDHASISYEIEIDYSKGSR